MKLGQGRFSRSAAPSGGTRSAAPARGVPLFSAAPAPTVHPAMASQPGTYGGPPGSFITRGACPPGYSRIAMPQGPGQAREYRCVPRVAAPAAPPPTPTPAPQAAPVVSPTITVSPVMQQTFDPQFSPVMQMTADSPGATQAAAPTQTAMPAQTGVTAPPMPQAMPQSTPMAPSLPPEGAGFAPIPTVEPAATVPVGTPPMPAAPSPGDWPMTPGLERAIAEEREKGLPMGLLLAAAGIGLFILTRNPKQSKPK